MLKFFVRHSRSEDFQPVAKPPRDNVWVRGDQVTDVDLRAIESSFGMDFNVLRDVLDKDELPRVETKTDTLYVFVRTVRRDKRGQVLTSPVLLAVKGTVFVDISMTLSAVRALPDPDIFARATDTMGLLLGTFAAAVAEYEEMMHHTARYIKDTGQRLRTHEVTNDDFVRFVTVEDNLNQCKSNLNGMLVVSQRLREILGHGVDTEAVEDIHQYIQQLLVAIDSHQQNITSIRNAYGTIANNLLNQRMKTLTGLTVLIALPNVFYGMYGMNIPLPFQEEFWAYPAMILLSFVVIVTIFLYARSRRIF